MVLGASQTGQKVKFTVISHGHIMKHFSQKVVTIKIFLFLCSRQQQTQQIRMRKPDWLIDLQADKENSSSSSLSSGSSEGSSRSSPTLSDISEILPPLSHVNYHRNNNPKEKTALCKFHILKQCRKGPLCKFAHGIDELKPLEEDQTVLDEDVERLKKTKLCKNLYGKAMSLKMSFRI